MKTGISRGSWTGWAGSAAVVAMVAVVGAAEARQDPQARDGGKIRGGVIQKGKNAQAISPPTDGLSTGAIAGIAVARPADQTACRDGAAAACRSIEGGLTTGGAWSFVDGNVTAMDDWERQSARNIPMGNVKWQGRTAADGNHIPQAVLTTHRVLAACDTGDVTACAAFAASVRPATASERTETRAYTAGR